MERLRMCWKCSSVKGDLNSFHYFIFSCCSLSYRALSFFSSSLITASFSAPQLQSLRRYSLISELNVPQMSPSQSAVWGSSVLMSIDEYWSRMSHTTAAGYTQEPGWVTGLPWEPIACIALHLGAEDQLRVGNWCSCLVASDCLIEHPAGVQNPRQGFDSFSNKLFTLQERDI